MTKARRPNWVVARDTRAKRDKALARQEIRGPSEPRVFPAGPMSAAIKEPDPDTLRMIAEFEKRRRA